MLVALHGTVLVFQKSLSYLKQENTLGGAESHQTSGTTPLLSHESDSAFLQMVIQSLLLVSKPTTHLVCNVLQCINHLREPHLSQQTLDQD